MWLGLTPYRDAWALQQHLAAARRNGDITDTVLLLEHPPVFTMGRNGEPGHLRAGRDALLAAGADYIDVDRGGSVTFHGPGQLVAYPILALAESFPLRDGALGDVVRYLRALEEALLLTASAFGVSVQRRPPYTGVWSHDRKLAAIGVKLARGVTTHGIALNVCTDLRWFDLVVPCGIEGAGVASLRSLGGKAVSPREVAPVLSAALADVFDEHLFEANAATRGLVERFVTAPAAA
jgi:lipoyl(octanoyl) transferase